MTNTQPTWTWQQSPDLMLRLRAAQNLLDHQDLMSFAGLCDSAAELERHVCHYEQVAAAVRS